MSATRDPEPPEPEDTWLQERYPAASADFVERTLARVRADRAEIESEAQRVEEIQFDPAFLDNLQVPAVAPGFVDHTLQKVMLQHRQLASGDRDLKDLVHEYQVPPVSEDFVRRTLSALGMGAGGPRVEPSRRRMFTWAAAAAALLLATALLLGPLLQTAKPAEPAGRPTAVYTPVRFGPVMATGASLQGERQGDGLLTLAYLGSSQGGGR